MTLFGLGNIEDFGARNLDKSLMRWWGVDEMSEKYLSYSPYNYVLNNPVKLMDLDGREPEDIVYINKRGEEVYRIKSETQFKTYIQTTANASNDPSQNTSGWSEVPMPNIIQDKNGENVSGKEYQSNDYQIAARTGYFNQAKNSNILDLVTEGGNKIPREATNTLPDLDPTLIKAITVQESNAGTTGVSDVMQANVKGDWGDGKMKSAYSLQKGEGASVTNSLYAGIRILATKGFKGGVNYNSKTGKTSFTFQGWFKAAGAYNSTSGTKGYQQSIETMYQNSKKPTPQDY